jgi:hypothetical protein
MTNWNLELSKQSSLSNIDVKHEFEYEGSILFSKYDTQEEYKIKESKWRQLLEKAYLITTVLEKSNIKDEELKKALSKELTKNILIDLN